MAMQTVRHKSSMKNQHCENLLIGMKSHKAGVSSNSFENSLQSLEAV